MPSIRGEEKLVIVRCAGEIVSATPRRTSAARWDELVFTIELFDGDQLVARVTNTWQIWRST